MTIGRKPTRKTPGLLDANAAFARLKYRPLSGPAEDGGAGGSPAIRFRQRNKKKGVPKMAIPKEARLSIPEMGMASFETLRDAKIALRRAGRKGSPRYANITWAMLRRFGRD